MILSLGGIFLIVNIQLNSGIEKIISIPEFRWQTNNQVAVMCRRAVGKGLQTAMTVKQLGGEPFLIGFNYSINGRVMTKSLEEAGILYDLVTVPGELPGILRIRDKQTGKEIVFQEPEGVVSEEAVQDLIFRVLRRADNRTIAVLSGEAPKGVPKRIYSSMIQDLKYLGARTVLDSSEMLLKDGVEAAPWMVTPNLTEMESLFQTVYQREEQVIEDARKLIVRGISLVCVSMGALGALLIERGGVWKAGPIPNLQGKIAKGAGCAMTAGLCLAAEQGSPPADMLRYGMAAAGAFLSGDLPQTCSRLDFEQMLPEISIQRLPSP